MLPNKFKSILILAWATLALSLLALHAQPRRNQNAMPAGKENPMFQLKSNAFSAEGNIPTQFTCEGANVSPDLSWSGAPEGTRTLALVLHDPDAPRSGGYTHWVVFNIPAGVNHLPEDAPKTASLPGGGIHGEIQERRRKGSMMVVS